MLRVFSAVALALCALASRAQVAEPADPGEAASVAGVASRPAAAPRVPDAAPTPARPPALPYRASDRFDRPTLPDEAPAYYAVRDGARLYAAPDESRPMTLRLDFREGVRVLAQEGPWSLILLGRTRAYVASDALSNVWIRVDKSERMLYVYRGPELLRVLPADVSTSDEDKTVRGRLGDRDTYRMPEGTYYVARLNPNSEYHRAFVISYPNREDAAQGLRAGVITEAQYEAIAEAEAAFREPPMGTALGGLIEIHGSGSGRQRAWTRGCVALRNVHMDWLWGVVGVGAPVVIEP